MNTSDIFEVQWLLSDFTWFADRGDGAALGGLFLPDAVLTVGGRDLRGREEIAADCSRRAMAAGRKTRHLWCNLRFERFSADEISTTAVQMTFEHTAAGASAQLRVNDIFDVFRKDESGAWRFASRIIKREMTLAVPVTAGEEAAG
jgi:hypothetical protein